MNSLCSITLIFSVVAAANARPALLGWEDEGALVHVPSPQTLGSFDRFSLPVSTLAEAQHHGLVIAPHDWPNPLDLGLGLEVDTQHQRMRSGLSGHFDRGSTNAFGTQDVTPREAHVPAIHLKALDSEDAFQRAGWLGYDTISLSDSSPSFLGQSSGDKRPRDWSFDTISSGPRPTIESYSQLDTLQDWFNLEHEFMKDSDTPQMGWDGRLGVPTAITAGNGYQPNSLLEQTSMMTPEPMLSVQKPRLNGPQQEVSIVGSVEALHTGSQSHSVKLDAFANLSHGSQQGSGDRQGDEGTHLDAQDFQKQALITRLENPKGIMSDSSPVRNPRHWRPLTPPRPGLENLGPVPNQQIGHVTLNNPGFTDLAELHHELYSPRVNSEDVLPAQAIQPDQAIISRLHEAHHQSPAHEEHVQDATGLKPQPNRSPPARQLDRSVRVTLLGQQTSSGADHERNGAMVKPMFSSLHSPPIHNVHEALVRRALLPFEKKLDWFDLVYVRYQKSKKTVFFKDVQARQLFGSQRRGQLASSVIRIYTTRGKYVSVTTMSYALQHLIRWLIYNNAAFLWKIEQSERVGQTGPAILDWLLKEFFNPENSAPVAGQIQGMKCSKEGAFGRVQQILIGFIAEPSPQDKAFETAVALIQSWYKESRIPGADIVFTDEDKFQVFMHEAVLLAKESHLALQLPTGDFPHPIDSLDNLKIYDLNDIPLPFQPRGLRQRLSRDERPIDGQRPSPVELEFITHMYKLYEAYGASGACQWDFLKPIPVVLVPQMRLMPSTLYAMRLLNEEGEIIRSSEVTRELSTMLLTFRHYHQVFLRFLKFENIEVTSRLQDSLWLWLTKALFGPEGEDENLLQKPTFPIFGVIKATTEEVKKFGFLPAQISLIKLLSMKLTQPDFDQVVISILGYWYKNECRDFWNTQFSDDYEFWVLMSRALDWHFTNR